jgi:CRISPR-associated protein Cas5t
MKELLEIQFEGWSATPRMPFILSGNSLCMATPSYSLILGLLGCCLGRLIESSEVQIGFQYSFDNTATDIETRQRLALDGDKIIEHKKGTDAYTREYHVKPRLIVWINRLDWAEYFCSPVGTPTLGRSQDLLKIKNVQSVQVLAINEAILRGCMLPFKNNLNVAGQLLQLAEAYQENVTIGSGRTATQSRIFISVPFDNNTNVKMPNLFETTEKRQLYLHDWS